MEISIALRRRIVAAYEAGMTGTYEKTAELYGIGRATVGRILRRHRETGDVLLKSRGGNNPRIVDLDWLRKHAEENPDARLLDRVEAWIAIGGKPLTHQAMSLAMRAIGWTHKKRRRSPGSATRRGSKPFDKRSSKRNRSSTQAD